MSIMLPLALLAIQAQPAPKAPAPNTEAADARCLVAFGAFGANGTPPQQEAAKLGALYYYGKLVGRNPRLDLTATMRTAAAAVQTQMSTELARCGGELRTAGAAMQTAGNALQGK